MKESDKNKISEASQNKNDDLLNLDKELKALISTNESFKIGISKILKELDKKSQLPNN